MFNLDFAKEKNGKINEAKIKNKQLDDLIRNKYLKSSFNSNLILHEKS